jgi:hypothetical protein
MEIKEILVKMGEVRFRSADFPAQHIEAGDLFSVTKHLVPLG